MRKVHVLTFVTLDGVMQAPGGALEDTSGGFAHGGWLPPYFDEALGAEMGAEMGQPFDLLLGRRTYDIFASHWPKVTDESGAGINQATKYVATHRPLATDWNGTGVRLGADVPAAIRALKAGSGRDLQVHGSGDLIQTLLAHDLVDELWLKIFPVTLSTGRRLFAEGTRPGALALIASTITPAGVIVAKYRRDGALRHGEVPSP
jgi:dihydrofolate reductase